ncbi:MAG TPA: DUF4936 family protein [Burkholderiales bacterium]|jgi:hypothetical protein|nr:DUF4936 family protein [Burkholderiales bacterium]
MTNYYVYYRVDQAALDSLRPRIKKLLEQIQNTFGIQGRWLRRRDDPSTYMEVYEGVADGKAFEALLERETAGFGLQRKTETFVDVPDRPRLAG